MGTWYTWYMILVVQQQNTKMFISTATTGYDIALLELEKKEEIVPLP